MAAPVETTDRSANPFRVWGRKGTGDIWVCPHTPMVHLAPVKTPAQFARRVDTDYDYLDMLSRAKKNTD